MTGPNYYTDGPSHLGGYIVGGDDWTYYPEMWTWLVREYGIESVLDIGCGEGHALDFFHGLGIRALGIDGIDQGRIDMFTHDFTTGPLPLSAHYEAVWMCEFVEHVAQRYVPHIMNTVRGSGAPLVFMTHAVPGQQGYHHVNCQRPDYWIGAFAAYGYELDETLTAITRRLGRHHYQEHGLAFARTAVA